LSVFFHRAGFRHVGQQRDIFWTVRASLWRVPTFIRCCTTISALGYKYYKTFELRKPYLKSGNSSETAYVCNAELIVSFLCVNVRKFARGPTFYRTLPTRVWIPSSK